MITLSAVLTVGGKIAAISIGEVIGDTLIIHIEKALKKYDGIYPAMYQGFVKLISSKVSKNLEYVNREDDSGDEGLRISKMQYTGLARQRLVSPCHYSPQFSDECPSGARISSATIYLPGLRRPTR